MSFDVRAAAERVVDHYVPSEYPDERFLDLVDNHWQPGGGTTCAYLTAKVLVLLGCRESDFVNHDDPEGLGRIRFEYGDTRNGVSKLVAGAKALDCWVGDGDGREPTRMDLVYMTVPGKEGTADHVEVFRAIDGATWEAAAAGQGTREKQRAEIVHRFITDQRASGGARYVSSLAGEPKRIIGWVDLARVPLVEPPRGPAAERQQEAPTRQLSTRALIAGGALLLVGASAGVWLRVTAAERRVLVALQAAERAHGIAGLATRERARRLARRGPVEDVVEEIGTLPPSKLEEL
jgi:hypothetical protein